MSTKLDSVDIPFAPETIGSGQSVLAAVASVWRRKLLVLGIVATALAVGIMAVVVMPELYKAQAYIRGEFFAAPDTVAKDADSTTTGSLSLDLVRVLETQSRLLESRLLARRVVQKLGLERLRPIVSRRPLLSVSFFRSAGKKATGDEMEIAAARLLEGLSVTSDPRAYLLTVSYKAGDPELAELITNAFVAELLRSAKLQTLFKQRSLSQASLSIQLAKFGDKHPNVAQARLRLAATDELLKKQLNEDYVTILQAAGENVTKAVSAPLSYKFVMVLLLLLGGLMVGVGVVLWLERNRWY